MDFFNNLLTVRWVLLYLDASLIDPHYAAMIRLIKGSESQNIKRQDVTPSPLCYFGRGSGESGVYCSAFRSLSS